MKGLAHFTLAVTLIAGAAEAQHVNHHRHLHVKRNAFAKRSPEVVVKYEQGPTETTYVLDGKAMSADEAKAGIADGRYLVVGESQPTFTTPQSTPTPKTTTQAAIFVEQKTTSSSSSETPKATSAAPSSSNNDSTSTGLDAEFPNGTIPCSSLPTQYGPRPLSWLGIDGWASIMQPGDKKWTPGTLIATLNQAVSGGCMKNSFCSYACPNGYQKTQWPETSQGATGQSIGGLWCNADGYLELTRPEVKTLCTPGAGGVFVQNNLSGKAVICQTDYPGNEKMSISLETSPGQKYTLTNPDAKKSYYWKGSPTSAQYYVNPLNVAVEDACVWNSPTNPDSAGNWAPVNLGVGKDVHGITYLSIFKNSPTSNAELDYDIEITGDITASCALKGGKYTGGGTGCTTAISKSGGQATIVLSKSS
ncbi:hypothetical protein MCOR25_000449 [Pyricularia grisea]|uniref:Uncharacterized protein n=1 Tax=Pyricularia grisea TaxID=148305 RepID=A0A6P8AV47_PYRGI|nr:uncharacterized protein PgNI_08840 [Pyricularia grisea]KAI6382940.1 hypothetical protein MCOR25_000449 [Pyricularia grisea]TLD06087.1 hypothetical protein PgNI_08840 [Pyricularia grisea]